MEALRSARISAMRQQQTARAENLAKGHGQYRMISQDEFLTEVTGSTWVALHFFHKEVREGVMGRQRATQTQAKSRLSPNLPPSPPTSPNPLTLSLSAAR